MARGQTIVAVQGERQLRRRLRNVEGGLAELKQAHKDVATIVSTRARSAAPQRTGRLAGSGRASGTNTASIIRFGNNTRLRYAGVIHYGWPARNITPQPWAIDTARRTESTWLAVYNDAVRSLVERTSAT